MSLSPSSYPSLNVIPPPSSPQHVTPSPPSPAINTFENLYPALVECFGIILLGYVAGKFRFVSDSEAKGLATFVGKFSLPALIFGNLITLDVSAMNWRFLLAILTAKTIVFISVLVTTILISHRGTSQGSTGSAATSGGLGRAGLFAIFTTQSNDFALGYPILSSIYAKTHPEIPMYLYLLAPVNLVILNPIGLICMEIDKQINGANASSSAEAPNLAPPRTPSATGSPRTPGATSGSLSRQNGATLGANNAPSGAQGDAFSAFGAPHIFGANGYSAVATPSASKRSRRVKMCLRIAKGIVTNPIIFMSVLGMIFGTFVFKGKPVPAVMSQFLGTLGNAFSATALFLLGVHMVGRVHSIKGKLMIVPAVLVAVKIVVFPLIARETTSLFNPGGGSSNSNGTAAAEKLDDDETALLSNFAFLYGTFPVAPTVFVFANQYNIMPEVIASGMVICTVVAAPIMFISAVLMVITTIDPADYMGELDEFMLNVSAVSLLASLWTAFVLVTSGNWRRVPHSQTLIIIASQTLISIGAIFWSFTSCEQGEVACPQGRFQRSRPG